MVHLALEHWRNAWTYRRNKHELGPSEDKDWAEYVNGLTMTEVLNELSRHSELVSSQMETESSLIRVG